MPILFISPSFHTHNIQNTPMKKDLMFIMLVHNKMFIFYLFYFLLQENDIRIIPATSEI